MCTGLVIEHLKTIFSMYFSICFENCHYLIQFSETLWRRRHVMANPPASKLHYWTVSLLLHPTEFGCFAATVPSSIHAPTKSRFVRSQQEVTNKAQKCSFRQMDYSSQ